MTKKRSGAWGRILNGKSLGEHERKLLAEGRLSYRDLRRISRGDGDRNDRGAAPGAQDPEKASDNGAPRNGKFNNRKTKIGEITFDSAWEAKRYGELAFLQKLGDISDLELQVSFPLVVNGVSIGKYVADFVYKDSDGKRVVEDAKGVKTRVYRIKKKLMKALHGIDIRESQKPERKRRRGGKND